VSARLEKRFAACAAQNRAALVTYITAGDPDLETSAAILSALPAAGADIIELGVAFTDPMADGPAIQLGNIRALASGITLRKTLAMVADFRKTNTDTPIVLMGYTNPIFAFGVADFVQAAIAAGVDGVIIVDLPPEEDDEVGVAARAAGLHVIRLATPTTDAARLPAVLRSASGFLYYVSMTGVTGTADVDYSSVATDVARIKNQTKLPIAVGFGIKTPAHAASVAAVADGVVVGSAIVSLIGSAAEQRANDIPARVAAFVGTLAQAVKGARA
jgi:tryptophan synthase alpha chain